MLTLAGLTLLTILVLVYVYFYMTLPNLHEHFVSESKKMSDLKKEYEALKKKYRKNHYEERQVNSELKGLKRNLSVQVKSKDVSIFKSGLLEYDIEKALAGYNKVKLEVDAVKSYYDNLQKEYIRVGKELSVLKDEHALDKTKCSLIDTKLIKNKRDFETLTKEVQAVDTQIIELKKQLALMVTKKDPLADTLGQVLADRQKQKTEIDKKLAEASTKMKAELKSQQELKRKLSIDEDKLTQLKKQQSLDERQLVQTKEKINKESEDKKRREVELKQIKESISIRDNVNKSLQTDVNKMRDKYNKGIKTGTDIVSKINEMRTKTVNESLEIKKLREAIEKLKKENAEREAIELEKVNKAKQSTIEKTSLMNIKYVRIAPEPNHNVPLELSQIVIKDETGSNIAKIGKITASSSNPTVKGPDRLINGDERASEWPDVWAQNSLPAWVEVELQKPSNIQEVVIYPREGTKYYLNGSAAVVWFYNEERKLLLKRSIPGLSTSKRVLNEFGYSGTPGNVKYLRIERINGPNSTEGYIQLNQLAAFDLDGKNVAKYQNVSAKHAHRFPEHIVDGELSYNRDGEKLYHSHGGRPDDWLEVELSKPTSLNEVRIYARGDCCQEAMAPFKLVLLDVNRKTLESFNLSKEKLITLKVTGKASEKA